MSDTPRTDAYLAAEFGIDPDSRAANFMRALERELAEAKSENAKLREALEKAQPILEQYGSSFYGAHTSSRLEEWDTPGNAQWHKRIEDASEAIDAALEGHR